MLLALINSFQQKIKEIRIPFLFSLIGSITFILTARNIGDKALTYLLFPVLFLVLWLINDFNISLIVLVITLFIPINISYYAIAILFTIPLGISFIIKDPEFTINNFKNSLNVPMLMYGISIIPSFFYMINPVPSLLMLFHFVAFLIVLYSIIGGVQSLGQLSILVLSYLIILATMEM